MYQKLFNYFIFFALTILVFKFWFLGGLITGGDFWPYFSSMYSQYPLNPSAWYFNFTTGLGGFSAPLLWILFNLGVPLTLFGKILGLSWNVIERIYYLFPILIISITFSSLLFKKVFPKSNFHILASFIYVFNTYLLMVIGGGQIIGIAMSYAISPLILTIFITITESKKINLGKLILMGLFLAIQTIFDIRILYITLSSLGVYLLITQQFKKPLKYNLSLTIPLIVAAFLNSFWILPAILVHQNPLDQLGSAYNSIDAVRFFSFAKLENTISLLHPNWPENIFGKVSFMKSEFLLLPIIAFSSLLFVNNEEKEKRLHILFFALLGLIGAFLAKGAQDPFGGIYLWLFEHFPGFIMFRDPTKWYIFVAISYSLLIPYSISKIYNLLNAKFKNQDSKQQSKIKYLVPDIFILLLTSYFLLLIFPALSGQLGGTFKSTTVPQEYKNLEQKISSDNQFYRTLWVPQIQRFAFFSNNHPAISANDLFKLNSPKDDINFLKNETTLKLLQESSVKYVIVPYDSLGEIFLTDRKCDQKVYEKTIKDIDSISYLRKIEGFGQISVYEIPSPKDHFWSPDTNLKINYIYINPTKYQINLKGAKKADRLIFSESFDNGWIAKSSKFKLQSSKFDNRFNSFLLPENGNYNLDVYYEPQKWVNIGSIISAIFFVTILVALVYLKIKDGK